MATLEVEQVLKDDLKTMAKLRHTKMRELTKEYIEEGLQRDQALLAGEVDSGKSDT